MDFISQTIILNEFEAAEIEAERRPRRIFSERNPFVELSDKQFIKLFRLSKNLVYEFVDDIKPFMESPLRRSSLSIQRKVLAALRFFATGSYQMDIGNNLDIGISQSSISRSIHEVINAANQPDVMNKWIKFPQNKSELTGIRKGFYQNYRFPGVYGCIDCTHIAIFPPKIHDEIYPEHAYVNRKGYHSINVQLICDYNLRIININARFPGSSHDVYIWNNSNARQLAEKIYALHGRDTFFLLGDSGYPLRPWLQTPIPNAEPNTSEFRYNERQMSCRSLIERCNGLLKMRFRCCLKHRVLHYSPVTASKIINTCAILHNMCISNNLPDPEPEAGDEEVDFGMHHPNEIVDEIRNAARVNSDLAAGRLLQNQIVRNYFN